MLEPESNSVADVLLAQLTPAPGDLAVNAAEIAATLGANSEVELAVFPEMFLGGYDLERVGETAVELEGPEVAVVRAAARGSNAALIVGAAERRGEGIANSLLAIDSDGEIVAVHRKTTLWGVEQEAFVAGESLTIVELAGRKVGLMLCYEVEFPEIARALAVAGAELLVTASANMAPHYDDHELASRARALDNRLCHIYVNRSGSENGLDFVAGTRLIDDEGQVVASADGAGEQAFVAKLPDRDIADGPADYLNNLPSVTSVVTAN
jgi:predicted amidohydrolase